MQKNFSTLQSMASVLCFNHYKCIIIYEDACSSCTYRICFKLLEDYYVLHSEIFRVLQRASRYKELDFYSTVCIFYHVFINSLSCMSVRVEFCN